MGDLSTEALFEKNKVYLSKREFVFVSEEIESVSFECDGVKENYPVHANLSANITNLMAQYHVIAIGNMIDLKVFSAIAANADYLVIHPAYEVRRPLYCIYDKAAFQILLQTMDLESLELPESVVFVCGEKAVYDLFISTTTFFPTAVMGMPSFIAEQLQEISKERAVKFENNKKNVMNYYKENENEIKKDISNGRFRVLFVTGKQSYSTWPSVYGTYEACKEMGYDSDICIEIKTIEQTGAEHVIEKIDSFKPNLIFCAHKTRKDIWAPLPDEIYYASWIQDPTPQSLNPATVKNLTERDFTMIYAWELYEGSKVGYPPRRTVRGTIPSNYNLYKRYILSAEEQKRFECDVCLVTHISDAEEQFANFEKSQLNVGNFGLATKKIVRECFHVLWENTINGVPVHSFLDAYNIINSVEGKRNILSESIKQSLIYGLWGAGTRAYKMTVANWLIDGGIENLKLWGLGWDNHEKYKPFACGPAKSGVELSKIYNGTKIAPGNSSSATQSWRVFESIASGSFYLSNYIPPKDDAADIRKLLAEGKEIIFFNGKTDLIDKISYYLTHEEERRAISERARKKVVNEITHTTNLNGLFTAMQKDTARRLK